MQQCVQGFIEAEPNSALLLVDIGVWPFHALMEKYPGRAKNIGIFEPGTVSLAAGLSLSGIVPTVYGISPFIAQRSLEQLKLDFVYQKAGGNFIVTGASYDFSTLGYSHYCPEDVGTLRLIPGMEIVTPGTPEQFVQLWDACHNDGHPTYFRMTDHCNKLQCPVEFGKACVLKKGTEATVVAVAETLDIAWEACRGRDVTFLYYTTMAPFDGQALAGNCGNGRILACTPFYKGTLSADIMFAMGGREVRLEECGVPMEILRNYGTKEEKDVYCGLTAGGVAEVLNRLLNEG